jgi:hypothetical protein
MPDLLTLTGRDGTSLHLLAANVSPAGIEAEGYISDVALRGGRVLTSPDGDRYRLASGVKPGVTWGEPIQLERRQPA